MFEVDWPTDNQIGINWYIDPKLKCFRFSELGGSIIICQKNQSYRKPDWGGYHIDPKGSPQCTQKTRRTVEETMIFL